MPDASFQAWRCHDASNARSDALRSGTWYAPDKEGAERYHSNDPLLRLGGPCLTGGRIHARNPFAVELVPSRVLHDAWETLPFGVSFREICFVKEHRAVRALTRRIVSDGSIRRLIDPLPDFTVKTMLADRIAAAWCLSAGHDLLVVTNGGIPVELFDFCGLFRQHRNDAIDLEPLLVGKPQ